MLFNIFSAFSGLAAIATVNDLLAVDGQSGTICCVAPDVPAGCAACYDSHVDNTLQATLIDSAYELATKHPAQFLSQYVFKDLYVDEFKYGRGKGGSIDTANMISQYITEPAGNTQLAIHMNSIVTASALQKNAMTIHVEKFHLTARSVATQKSIDQHGPSSITAEKSIHIGVNQPSWGPAKPNLKNLEHEIGADPIPALRKQGYNTAHVIGLTKDFKTKVTLRIHQLLGGNVVVHWTGDKSFPV